MYLKIKPTDSLDGALAFLQASRERDLTNTRLAADLPEIVLELAPGSYTTAGRWASDDHNYVTGPRGGRFRLVAQTQNPETCIIRMTPQTACRSSRLSEAPGFGPRPDRDIPIAYFDQAEVDGITFDCNGDQFESDWYPMGPQFHGRYKLQNFRILDWRGSYEHKVEAFASTSFGDTTGSTVTHGYMNNSAHKGTYSAGIMIGQTAFPVTDSLNALIAAQPSVMSHLVFDMADDTFWAVSANANTVIERVVSNSKTRHFFYNDTGPTLNVVLNVCSGNSTYAALRVLIPETYGAAANALYATSSTLHGERIVAIEGNGQMIAQLSACRLSGGPWLASNGNPGSVYIELTNCELNPGVDWRLHRLKACRGAHLFNCRNPQTGERIHQRGSVDAVQPSFIQVPELSS